MCLSPNAGDLPERQEDERIRVMYERGNARGTAGTEKALRLKKKRMIPFGMYEAITKGTAPQVSDSKKAKGSFRKESLYGASFRP